MEERFQRLAEQLLLVNPTIASAQARTWVESLWEDFETTRAKSGRSYQGQDVTEQVVTRWIQQYGPYLHKYEPGNKKFAHLNNDDYLKH